jgi:hypothetical protein
VAIVNRHNRTADQNADVEKREIDLRAHMAEFGYRLMHRRNGQYWLMIAEPMTLDQIEDWAQVGDRSRRYSRKNNHTRKVR